MAKEDEKPADSGLADEVIGNLYEVAVDPTRYEILLDHWEEMMRPQRAAANDTAQPLLRQFDSHFQRADQVLDRIINQATTTEAEAMLAQIERTAAFVVDRSLTVTAVNTAAAGVLGVTRGARVTDLALGLGEADLLARHIDRMMQGNA